MEQQCQQHREHRRSDNALQCLFLFLCHEGSLRLGYKKRPSAGWAALWQNLQLDLEIRLDLLGGLDGILQHGVELVVVGLQQ